MCRFATQNSRVCYNRPCRAMRGYQLFVQSIRVRTPLRSQRARCYSRSGLRECRYLFRSIPIYQIGGHGIYVRSVCSFMLRRKKLSTPTPSFNDIAKRSRNSNHSWPSARLMPRFETGGCLFERFVNDMLSHSTCSPRNKIAIG